MLTPPPSDVVVLELPPDEAAAAAIDSCRLVLGMERCRDASQPGPPATYRAVVKWEAGERFPTAHLVVQWGTGEGVVSVRDVEFSADDTLVQRYRAIGLLVVSHVVADSAARASRQESLPREPAEQQTSPWSFGVDLAAQWGTGPTSGLSRWGAAVRPWVGPFDGLWRPFARLGWIGHSGGIDLDGYETDLGLGLRFGLGGPLFAEVRASGVLQFLRFRAFDAVQGADRASLTRYGGRLGLETEIEISSRAGFWLGFEVLAANPPYSVEVMDRRLGGEDGPKWSGIFGLRFQP